MTIARIVDKGDRARIVRALARHAPHDVEALRTRALVTLAWGGALRASEVLALDVDQVTAPNGAIRSHGFIRAEQSKGHNAAGPFVITRDARTALRAYLKEARRRGWVGTDGPLFIRMRRKDHGRLSRFGARAAWKRVQERAGIEHQYRFHDLRHDAITRFSDACNGNAFRVARFARLQDVRTALRYVHASIDSIAKYAELAERG